MKTLKFMLAVAASIVASCVLADRVVDADYTLAADEDWSAAGRVLMADGVKIDLNGHSLKTSGFAEYIPVAYVETDGSQWVNTPVPDEGRHHSTVYPLLAQGNESWGWRIWTVDARKR